MNLLLPLLTILASAPANAAERPISMKELPSFTEAVYLALPGNMNCHFDQSNRTASIAALLVAAVSGTVSEGDQPVIKLESTYLDSRVRILVYTDSSQKLVTRVATQELELMRVNEGTIAQPRIVATLAAYPARDCILVQ